MSTKLKFGGILLCLFSTFVTLQGQTTSEILVYDLQTKSLDTLSTFGFDPTITTDHTKHYCGEKKTARLKQEVPKSNLVSDTKFTNLVPLASMESDLAFPYTTSVKIILPDSGDKHQASGVMVGEKFVLTAGHSVLKKYTNESSFEKIDVIAAYDHVLSSDEELRSAVRKIYFVKDWRIGEGEDLVLLELEDAIGARSGWMSIGFEQESKLVGKVFHKLSYPAYNTPYNDKPFTGDDLHMSYGVADYISLEFLGVENHIVGLGGESGSPIFTTDNNDEYITYGVLTFLGNYNHTRIRPSIYYAFESILGGESSTWPTQSENLKNFEASNIAGDRVMLSWSLDNKTAFDGYEITRSYDNENFEFLQYIDAAEINKYNLYGYIDQKPLAGVGYYKLMGIDKDEKENFLGIKSIKVGKESKFDINIYPNPTTDYLIIDAKKEIDSDVDLMIYNSNGKIITEQKLEPSNTINTQDLQKGIYHIFLLAQDVKESFSFVVQ